MVYKTTFLLAIAVFVGVRQLSADVIMPTPTHHYPFDVDASDVTGTNDGLLVGGASIVPDSERENVLDLDGVNDYVSLPFSALPSGPTDTSVFTIAGWVKIAETIIPEAHQGGIYGEHARGRTEVRSHFGVDRLTESGVVYFEHTYPNGGNFRSQSKINDLDWHHVAYVQNEAGSFRRKVYIDGKLDMADNFPERYSGPTPSLFLIGAHVARGRYTEGSISDLRFYDVALSADQIGVLAIPEPSCLCLLLGLGGVGLLAVFRRHKRRAIALIAGVILVVVAQPAPRAEANIEEDPPQASTVDVWNGATITDHSPVGTTYPFSIDNVLGGVSFAGQTPIRNCIFQNSASTPQFLEWEISEPTTIARVGVFLQHDSSDVDKRRALDVTILAKANPADTFTPILTQALSDPVAGDSYGGGQFGTSNVDYSSVLDVNGFVADARFFRAEFTPNTVGASGSVGVRVLELDGHPVPEPGSMALLVCGAFTLLGFAWRRRSSKGTRLFIGGR